MEKSIRKKKIENILFGFLYSSIILGLCICVSIIYHNKSFESIFVSGSSMKPTLNENIDGETKVEYGTIDTRQSSINRIKRFDIVTTYYPWEDYDSSGNLKSNASFKIKRVLAVPGDRFYILAGAIVYIENIDGRDIETVYDDNNALIKDKSLPFNREFDLHSKALYNSFVYKDKPLPENCYWVQGDHWSASSDCLDTSKPISKNNIYGVLISINGEADTYYKYTCTSCNHVYQEKVNKCSKCGGVSFLTSEDIKNLTPYSSRKYFL